MGGHMEDKEPELSTNEVESDLGLPNEAEESLGLPTLITLMRIYDVQMSILTHLDETSARNLNEIHERGELLFSLPRLAPDTGQSE